MFLQISIPRHKVQHHRAPGADCLSRQEATQDGGDDDEDGDDDVDDDDLVEGYRSRQEATQVHNSLCYFCAV